MEAFDAMASSLFDLFIPDIMMPEINGFQFAQTVREQNRTIPILFTTARDDFFSGQKEFRIGIDDYMGKPLDLDELVLRVGALLRRANIAQERKLIVGNIVLNVDEITASHNHTEIPVTVNEFNFLFKLLSNPGRTFTRTQLMDEFWGLNTDSNPGTVDDYITKLRDKFSACDDFELVMVYGLGYKR